MDTRKTAHQAEKLANMERYYNAYQQQGITSGEAMVENYRFAALGRFERENQAEYNSDAQDYDCAHHYGSAEERTNANTQRALLNAKKEIYANEAAEAFRSFLIEKNRANFKLFLFGRQEQNASALCQLPDDVKKNIFSYVNHS